MYVILSDGEYEGVEDNFNEAETRARELMEKNGWDSVIIYEVVKAWCIEVPPEPQPELSEIDLTEV